MRLVLASHNARKLAELEGLFAALPIELVSQRSLSIDEPPEPHVTFLENALAKARHAALHARTAAIADDSGLCVDALGGAPGVASAHYASVDLPIEIDRETRRGLQDAANQRLLLERLQGQTQRRARFVATLVAVRAHDDPEPLVAVGRWHGEVLHAERGHAGFGYDPLLYIPELGCSVAELPAATKAAHSHRALAARAMVGLMREVWGLG